MTIEQVERHNVDQFELSLECCKHIGREPGRRVTLAREPLANVAPGIDELGSIGSSHMPSLTERPYGWVRCAPLPQGL